MVIRADFGIGNWQKARLKTRPQKAEFGCLIFNWNYDELSWYCLNSVLYNISGLSHCSRRFLDCIN